MEDEYLKAVWNSTDTEMNQSIAQQDPSFEMNQLKKAKTRLRSLLFPKIVGIVLGFAWIAFLFLLLYLSNQYSANSLGKLLFMGSIGMILLVTGIAVILYTKDIFTLRQIEYSESILLTQQRLITLHASMLNSVRISWLQLPFYTTFYLNEEMLVNGGPVFWIFQILVTGGSIWLAIWLYRNINNRNIPNKRIRTFLQGYGFDSLLQASDYLKEIECFGNDAESNTKIP